MLRIIIPPIELYDQSTNEFSFSKQYELQLEHSLVSLSKWESRWHMPFLSAKGLKPKTNVQILDYIKCMTMTQNVDPSAFNYIKEDVIRTIFNYIDDPMTATTFSNNKNTRESKEIITSELIYYWMISFNIPIVCEKWHLNRLLTLINVCNIKGQPNKKMSKKQMMAERRALNEARKAQYQTAG